MAMMLIDQTKDAACKTAEADAIRAKTGGSASLAYDWANNKGFADAIAAIPSGGGGGGLILLGSGTYNKGNDSASISIPVTYTGTPRLFYAVNTTPKAETAQTIMFGRWIAFADADAESVLPAGGLWMAKGVNASGTAVTTANNGAIPQLSSTAMSSIRPGPGYTHCAGTWKWYIYGEAST